MSEVVAPGERKFNDMAEMHPQKLVKRKDGFWVEMRDVTMGPFENKRAADIEMGKIQTEIMGWVEPKGFIGIVFQQGENKWWVDRWTTEDGPFATRELAQAHKDKLLERRWTYE